MQTKNASPKAKKCQEHEKGTIIVRIDSFKDKNKKGNKKMLFLRP